MGFRSGFCIGAVPRRTATRLGGLLTLVLAGGCWGAMSDQDRYDPLESSVFFADGKSARELVPGVVPRGHLQLEEPLYTGRRNGEPLRQLPIDLDLAVLERGQQRYDIFCSPCHDRVGSGDGMAVRRGFTRPPSLHTTRLREEEPVGHLFAVITDGVRDMPPYGHMINVQDRWAIVAYLRALQRSQYLTLEDAPADIRRRFEGEDPPEESAGQVDSQSRKRETS